jgi:hypothetical protein
VSLKSDKNNGYFTRRPMYIYDISLNSSQHETCFTQNFNIVKTHFSCPGTSKMLHLEYSFYGAETWTLRAVDQKQMESFQMWC